MTDDTTAPAEGLGKHFDFAQRELPLFDLWEQRGCFRPEFATDQNAPVFNLTAPPPNANGEAHLGHAFGYTVMDVLARFHRANGNRVMILPGKDHAGIQTQVVFEKKLKSDGEDAAAISRTDLYDQCYAFCEDRAQYMRAQEKRLGFGADYSRELFTLDPRLTHTIYDTFIKLWNDGLVYRGHRIINWSVFSQTSISDVEVEYKEQAGSLWYISYPIVSGPSAKSNDEIALPNCGKLKIGNPGIVTATTRPETMLGDTALAVNPEDPRYKDFIGARVRVPLIGREIPIVADARVDPTYGTGVIKVTPAHDFTDYDIGQDHKLELVQVIGKDGKMTPAAGAPFEGMTALDCRAKVIEKLTEENCLVDTTSITHKVPIGERGKDIIEPLISEQWFVAVDKPGMSLKQRALDFLTSGEIKIFPQRFQSQFEQWLHNLRDWNISRQLWWGQRLPVWYRRTDGKEEIYVGHEAPHGNGWEEETDVFDTWFSSGQWAFSTVAAQGLVDLDVEPVKSDHFPTHTMVMGRDILLFWACRMLLLTTYRCNAVPWKKIFFTGLLRDEHGQKMSKSKGNGIDPMEMIEKHGSDSLRLALLIGTTPGNDISFSVRKVEGYSKFVNKLWNAAKLIDMKVRAAPERASSTTAPIASTSQRWIREEIAQLQKRVHQKITEYELSIALDEIYNFVWTTYCDWYLEIFKIMNDRGTPEQQIEARSTAIETFRALLVMLHPYIPFVTEEIYQQLPYLKKGETLCELRWEFLSAPESDTREIGAIMEVVEATRSVKAALQISHLRIKLAYSGELSPESKLLIEELARIEWCEGSSIPAEKGLPKPVSKGTVLLEVEGKDQYRKKLEKDLDSNRGVIKATETKLAGSFAQHAKPEVVEKEREKLATAQRVVSELEKELQSLA